MMNSKSSRTVVYVLAAIGLLLLPIILQSTGSNSWVRIVDIALLYVLLALGLNIVVGYAGLLDLGFVAFFAVGAYLDGLLASPHLVDTFAWVATNFPNGLHVNFWVVMVMAAVLAVAAVLALVLAALLMDFRERIALAVAVALVLGVAQHRGWLYRWPDSPVLAYLGRISYGVFLMNFPVSLVVNAAFTRFAPPDVWVQSAGVLLAWVACVGAGALFFHAVGQPLRRWSARPQSLPRPRVLLGIWLLLATILTTVQ